MSSAAHPATAEAAAAVAPGSHGGGRGRSTTGRRPPSGRSGGDGEVRGAGGSSGAARSESDVSGNNGRGRGRGSGGRAQKSGRGRSGRQGLEKDQCGEREKHHVELVPFENGVALVREGAGEGGGRDDGPIATPTSTTTRGGGRGGGRKSHQEPFGAGRAGIRGRGRDTTHIPLPRDNQQQQQQQQQQSVQQHRSSDQGETQHVGPGISEQDSTGRGRGLRGGGGGRGRGDGRNRRGAGRGRDRTSKDDASKQKKDSETKVNSKNNTSDIVTTSAEATTNDASQAQMPLNGRNRTGSKKQDSSKNPEPKNKVAKNKELDQRIQEMGQGPDEHQNTSSLEQPIRLSSGTKSSPSKEPQNQRSDDPKPAVSTKPHAPEIPPNQPQQTSDLNYGKGETIRVLHVAEKPSIATSIAHGLCKSSINTIPKSLAVHEFTGPAFPKAPHAMSCKHRVTSVAGHVFAVDFPAQFQSWESTDPAELFHAPIARKPQKGSIVKHLEDEAKGVDFIVLWMDCDREGENINFEVLHCCLDRIKSSPHSSNYDRVYRAYFSAINPSDIQKAYYSLGKPDQNQSLAVDARQELDLKVGVAFSRFQTRYFQGRYGDLDSAVLSYGPCQTPTLGFCVQRHVDIETFFPEPFWVLELNIVKMGRSARALWNAGRSFNKGNVEALQAKAHQENPASAAVSNVIIKEKKQVRPVPLNTVALLKACSKALGIGPHMTMQIAERLYLSGYLSYPRTESTAYPKSFDINSTLREQRTDNRWGAYVNRLLAEGHHKSRGGIDMGDHPPITPVRAASNLSGDTARVYDLVVRHFLASVSPDAIFVSTRVDFAIEALGDKGTFTVRGKRLVYKGFLEVLLHHAYGDEKDYDDEDEDEEERDVPDFEKGEVIPLYVAPSSSNSSKVSIAPSGPVRATLDIKEKKTTPPSHITESELIGMMEKHGIGTDASIPTHIENIQKRNYVALETGRRLVPSKLGLVLVQGYHQIDSSLVLPQVRSDIEGQCNKIAKGLASREEVVHRATALFRAKFDVFVQNINKMDILFGTSFSKLEEIGKPFTRCGLTRRYLQYIPGPPPRLYNKWTETVYPLPAGGFVKQWSGRTCPVEGCNFELCQYSVGQPLRTFPLCPRCFNDPDWALDSEDLDNNPDDRADQAKENQIRKIAGKVLVLECPLPDEHPLIEAMTVSSSMDPDGDGVLILDVNFGPKWRLVSTRDPTIVHLPQCIEKVSILDRIDPELEVHLMKIEFKSGQSPLIGGSAQYTTCFATDTLLQGMTSVHHGSDHMKSGGRGRGRGRGGRGRGRGVSAGAGRGGRGGRSGGRR